jgi:hypothetical protein
MLINPRYISRDYFIERMTNLFLTTFGSSFKDFLQKNSGKIKKYGYYTIDDLSLPIVEDFEPKDTNSIWSKYSSEAIELPKLDFINGTLELFADREGYIKMTEDNKNEGLLELYLNSLMVK